MNYQVNENGETLTLEQVLQDRNEELWEKLECDYQQILQDYEIGKRKQRMGGRITQCIVSELSKIPPMKVSDYSMIDADCLQAYYTCFLDFMKHYNQVEPPITKPLLCTYMRIPLSKFLDFLQSNDVDVQNLAQMIENDFDAQVYSSAEASNNKTAGVVFRGKVKDSGSGMVAQSEELNFAITNATSPELAMLRAKQLMLEKGLD